MTLSSPASSIRTRELEVRLLIDMVRLSRVTLLIAEPGAEKSLLLRSSVVPLLTDAGDTPIPDVAVLFDSWASAPLPALRSRIRELVAASVGDRTTGEADPASLAACLRSGQDALACRFVIIFDRFEDYLRTPSGRVTSAEFEDELVQAVNDPTLRAHFLLAIDEDAEPLLARLRERIPRLGYSRVRLPRANGATPIEQPARPVPVQAPPSVAMRITPVPAGAAAAPPARARAGIDDSASDEPRSKPTSIEILAAAKAAQDMSWRTPRPRTDEAQGLAKAPTQLGSGEERPSAKVSPRASTPVAAEPSVRRAPEPVQENHRAEPVQAKRPTEPVQAKRPAEPVDAKRPTEPLQAKRPAEPVPAAPAASPKSPEVVALKSAVIADAAAAQKVRGDAADTLHRDEGSAPSGRPDDEGIAKRPRARRLSRFAWVPIALAIFAVFVFVQPGSQQIVERGVAPMPAGESTSTPEGAIVETAKAPLPATSVAANADVAAVAPKSAPPVVGPSPANAPEERTARTVPGTAAIATEKPRQLAAAEAAPSSPAVQPSQRVPAPPKSATREIETAAPNAVRKAEPREVVPAAKPPSAAAQAPAPRRDVAPAVAASAPASRPTDARTSQPAAAASARPTEAVAAKPPVVAGVAPADAAAVPSVYINVRSEAQRAWAEQQLVRPLTDRGFRVLGIRVVASGPEVADIRYNHLSQRDEAIRIGVALRDSGVRAQHLKHLDETVPPAPARQYEIWLPPAQ